MSRTTRGVIFDIDGVLEFQGTVYPQARATVQALRRRGVVVRFLTNSTLKSRAACAARLRSHGFEVADEEVFTASYLTAQYLRQLKPRSCWVMVEGTGLDEFQEFPRDAGHPEYLVVGDNRSAFDFAHLNQALGWLLHGSKLFGMQAELLDNSMGAPELNVGSWVGMLERAAGIQAVYIGKPGSFAFEQVLDSMKLPTDQVAVVGDRVQTDIAGAVKLGLFSVLVRTGEFREEDLHAPAQPQAVIDDIGELLTVLPGLRAASGTETASS